MAHTPGPWRYQHLDGYGADQGHIIRTHHHTSAAWSGTMIAEVNGIARKTLSAPEDITANAALIAAAPELWDMLARMLAEAVAGDVLDVTAREAAALLARAEG